MISSECHFNSTAVSINQKCMGTRITKQFAFKALAFTYYHGQNEKTTFKRTIYTIFHYYAIISEHISNNHSPFLCHKISWFITPLSFLTISTWWNPAFVRWSSRKLRVAVAWHSITNNYQSINQSINFNHHCIHSWRPSFNEHIIDSDTIEVKSETEYWDLNSRHCFRSTCNHSPQHNMIFGSLRIQTQQINMRPSQIVKHSVHWNAWNWSGCWDSTDFVRYYA